MDTCQITTVNNTWNFTLLMQLLVNCHDQDIVNLLKYGWPIPINENLPLEMGGINHKGATEYEQHIDEYIEKEISLGATIGPFEAIPFKGDVQVAISPLSTRSRKDSNERRIIMECSWHIGVSLHSGIDKDEYLGEFTNLKYLTMDDLAKRIYKLSQFTTE